MTSPFLPFAGYFSVDQPVLVKAVKDADGRHVLDPARQGVVRGHSVEVMLVQLHNGAFVYALPEDCEASG